MSSRPRRKAKYPVDGFTEPEPAAKRVRGSEAKKENDALKTKPAVSKAKNSKAAPKAKKASKSKTSKAAAQHVPSRLMELPTELQLLILFFCDKKSMAAMAETCTHFEEISMRLMWEMHPVDTLEENFATLDAFEDLRRAVKHLRVSKDFIGWGAKPLTAVGKLLIERLKEDDYFPSLTHFTIDVHGWQANPFGKIMETLTAHQPPHLKNLIVKVGETTRTYHYDLLYRPQKEAKIKYPKGMEFIKVEWGFFENAAADFDPYKAFDASKTTLVDVDLYVENHKSTFSKVPCLKVKRVAFGQSSYSVTVRTLQDIRNKFPNTERLEIRGKNNKGIILSTATNEIMYVYKHHCWIPKARTIKFVFVYGAKYSRKKKEGRDQMIKYAEECAIAWANSGRMPHLQRIEGFKGLETGDHAFNVDISRDSAGQVLTTVHKIIRFPGDDEEDIMDEGEGA